jgi:hypothetical protein
MVRIVLVLIVDASIFPKWTLLIASLKSHAGKLQKLFQELSVPHTASNKTESKATVIPS